MKFELIIGDWSGDGHSMSETILFEVNKTEQEINEAYKNSCRLVGIQFNSRPNYTNLTPKDYRDNDIYVMCDYEDNTLSENAYNKLSKFIDIDDNDGFNSESLALLIMKFISLSLTDFQYKIVRTNYPNMKGFGYGLFM